MGGARWRWCDVYLPGSRSGVNQWRDQMKPSQILDNVARLKGLSKPRTEDNGNTLTFMGRDYTLAEFGKDQSFIS